jgi:cell division protein FtsW (lipid II flippase)
MDFELPDISNFRDMSDLLYIFFAIVIVEFFTILSARYYKIGGQYLNEWYDEFNILAVIADIMILFIGIIIARYIYTLALYQRYEWNPIYFIILLLFVQVTHDLIFYLGVIKPVPAGHNEMMDIFKKYSNDIGAKALLGDAILIVSSGLIAMLLKYIPFHIFVSVSAIFTYGIPYILYTRNPYVLEESKKKNEEKEKKKQNPDKIDAYGRLI